MRGKRPVTILFLMFASMLLLAHSILPHYHHDSVVCFIYNEISACDVSIQESDACAQSCAKDAHHHGSFNDCDLKDIVLRQDNTHDYTASDVLSLYPTFYILYSLSAFYLEAPEFGFLFQEKPYLNNYTSPLLGLNLSLRGPPLFSLLS